MSLLAGFFLDGFLALACYSNSGKPEFWIFGPEFFQLRPEFSGQKKSKFREFLSILGEILAENRGKAEF